jgi:hypothetical protein
MKERAQKRQEGHCMTTEQSFPRLVLQVGITGYRDLSADDSRGLSIRVRRALELLKEALENLPKEARACYNNSPASLRAISPLAEGADRIFALEALALNCELACLLPFHKEEYCRDFLDDASKREFEGLMGKASAVLELNGFRDAKPNAYKSMGQLMLDHCDILFAIYSKKHESGEGGTAEIVNIAERRQIPIIWLDPDESFDQLIHSGTHPFTPQACAQIVLDLIQPPWLRRGKEQKCIDEAPQNPDFTGSYIFSETNPKSLMGAFWNFFMKIMTAGTGLLNLPDEIAFPEFTPVFQENKRLIDKAAERLAGLYRGAFLANYTLGVFAIFFALLSYAASNHYRLWLTGELAAIAFVLLIVTLLRKHRWHSRMVDCRYLAECFRIAGYLRPLGIMIPDLPLRAHQAHVEIRNSWMNWRLKAALREAGIADGRIAHQYLKNYLRYINSWIAIQIKYHLRNAMKMHRADEVLHYLEWILFVIAALGCLLHLVIHNVQIVPWLTLCAAGFPAAAAACHAISNQGEFRRLAERSEAMAASLDRLKTDLDKMESSVRADELSMKAIEIAQVMLDEVADWQILYRKPPFTPA